MENGVCGKNILQLVKATDRQIKWKLKELISLWLGSKCAFRSFLWRLCAVGGLMSFHHLTFHIVYFTVLCCSFVAIYSFSLFRSVWFFFVSAIVSAIHGNVSFSRKLFWWDWKTLFRWLSHQDHFCSGTWINQTCSCRCCMCACMWCFSVQKSNLFRKSWVWNFKQEELQMKHLRFFSIEFGKCNEKWMRMQHNQLLDNWLKTCSQHEW